jgi:ABC-type uncharacterized transport system permease subunit
MKLGMRIMVLEPISTACFINPSHRSVCLHVYPLIVARQRLGKHIPAVIVGIVGGVLYAVRVVSKENRRLVLTTFVFLPLFP